jgi:hypothetical protein
MLVQDLIVKIIVDDEVLPKFNNFFSFATSHFDWVTQKKQKKNNFANSLK